MNAPLIAAIALIPALAAPAFTACRGSTLGRLVAVQLATAISSLILALLSFAFDQSSFVDLALTLELLSYPGTLVMTLFLERWV